jgi:hypothetical protein
MYYFNFDLSEYKLTKYSFELFEILLKESINTKEAILNDLKIVYSTYRKCKHKEQEAGVEIVKRLNEYFNINALDYDRINYYERLLSRTIEKIYYRDKSVYLIEVKELEECINENNVLKTVFQLFKLYINMTDVTKNRSYIVDYLKQDYLNIKKYKDVLSNEILAIYNLVETFYEPLENINLNQIDIVCDEYPYIKGLLYPILSTKYYVVENYDRSLIYALKAKEVYERECNINRLLTIKCNISNLYLILEKYYNALNNIKESASMYYLFQQEDPMFSNFKSIYYSSLYFNNKIDEIIYSINRCKVLQNVDYLFRIICNVKKGKYESIKSIKEECDSAYENNNGYNYTVIYYIYDYFILNKYTKKDFINIAIKYKDTNKYISDILLDLME